MPGMTTGAKNRSYTGQSIPALSGVSVLPVFFAHRSNVQDLSFSHDGQHLASCASDGSILIWDASSGRVERTLKNDTRNREGGGGGEEESPVFSLCFLSPPNSHQLAAGFGDGAIRIWDICSDKADCRETRWSHGSVVVSLACSPDGKYLISASSCGELCLWDTGTHLATKYAPCQNYGQLHAMTLSPDGTTVVLAYSDTFGVWTLPSRAQLGLGQVDSCRNKGQYSLQCFNRNSGCCRAIAFSSANTDLIISALGSEVTIWRLLEQQQPVPVCHIQTAASPRCLGCSPNGEWLFFGFSGGNGQLCRTRCLTDDEEQESTQMVATSSQRVAPSYVEPKAGMEESLLGKIEQEETAGSLNNDDLSPEAERDHKEAEEEGEEVTSSIPMFTRLPGLRSSNIEAVAFSPDSTKLCLGFRDGSVRFITLL